MNMRAGHFAGMILLILSALSCASLHRSGPDYLVRSIEEPYDSAFVRVLDVREASNSTIWVKLEFVNNAGYGVVFDASKLLAQDSAEELVSPSYRAFGVNRATQVLNSELKPGTEVAGPLRGKLLGAKQVKPGHRTGGILIFEVDSEHNDRIVLFFPGVKDLMGETVEMAPVVLEIIR